MRNRGIAGRSVKDMVKSGCKNAKLFLTEPKIIGIVRSYRKNGIINSVVSEILSAAATQGSETQKIYLLDKKIEF